MTNFAHRAAKGPNFDRIFPRTRDGLRSVAERTGVCGPRLASETTAESARCIVTKEVRAVPSQMDGQYRLMAQLLYGSGLRLLECLHVLNRPGIGVKSPLD
jgi:hypothetical protein